jgi:phosphatidylserine decarboxylase
MEYFKTLVPSIHREGIFFLMIGLVTAILLCFISTKLAMVMMLVNIFILFFFRDPERFTVTGENFIVSPADGYVTSIQEAVLPETLGFDGQKTATRVSIFLSVFDVHVNRVPADGIIKETYYHHGMFLNASLDKASVNNERQEILMEMKNGKQIVFTQIAGLIARRIVCYAKPEQEVKAGERFGIIRFGSRMDVYLPDGVKPQVFVGHRVIGGETVIANIDDNTQRTAEIR